MIKKTIFSFFLLLIGFGIYAQNKNYAMIYIYRPKSATINTLFPVIFNNREIHQLPRHSKLSYKIYSEGMINMKLAGNVKIDLQVEHGREYYIKCPNNGVSEIMFESAGKQDFNNEKLFPNGYVQLEEDPNDPIISKKNQIVSNVSIDTLKMEKPVEKPLIKITPSDVDIDIPVNSITNLNTYVLIIGNEDYSSFQTDLTNEVNVDFAINDAKVFKEYCNKTMGIPEKQIKLLTNATYGQMNQGVSWLNNLAKIENGNAELIFYYSGHGLPDEQTKEAYLIPVDISGSNVSQGIKLNDVYKKLNEYPTKKTTVFLDACFSGGARNQGLVAMKGVKIKPKENLIEGNIVVFSSSTGEESSGVYREKQHGFFTYFLLKKLQETKGFISYKELFDYIIYNVKKESTLGGKTQTPQVNGSPSIENTWSSWKFR